MTTATIHGPRPQSALSVWANKHRRWLFAGPSMLFIFLLIIFPIVWTFWLSLTDAAGSVRFPDVDPGVWREVRREPRGDFDFVGYQRRA